MKRQKEQNSRIRFNPDSDNIKNLKKIKIRQVLK
jgi:hypothetical protein